MQGAGTSTLRIQCESITTERPDPVLVGKLRGSVLLLGPLLARRGAARLAPPGGDFPARRTISTHLQALMALGAVPVDEPGHALDAPDGLTGASFYLDEASVTGTETALLAAAAARGRTEIRHAAMEPHVVELCHCSCGRWASRIEGIGTPTIRVEAAGAVHGRDASPARRLRRGRQLGRRRRDHRRRDHRHRRARRGHGSHRGAACGRWAWRVSYEDERFSVSPSTLTATRRITTGLWPGFPSDMVSLVTVLATQADGRTLVHDWLYELRLFALEQLSAMRADLFLCDPHRIIVSGPKKLRGRLLDARDLRSGMALIAAALAAEGESRVTPLETVERGYASLVERLRSLGASVERESYCQMPDAANAGRPQLSRLAD